MRVLINYKFTDKKLKLTQKVNNVHLFQFTVRPLFNSLFDGHVFSFETSRIDENVSIRVTIKRAWTFSDDYCTADRHCYLHILRFTAVYSSLEKGCRKKWTRQSRKVLWVILSSLFFKEIWKKGTRGQRIMFANAKRKQQ